MSVAPSRFVTDPVTGCDRGNPPLSPRDVVAQIIYVIWRLEEAGATLLALPMAGYGTGMRVGTLEVMREAQEAYGYTETAVRASPPSPEAITRMDQSLAWLGYIPKDEGLCRLIVGARCMVHPVTERHIYSWRRLARRYGLDHATIQRRHTQGVGLIVARLQRDRFIFPC